MTCAKKLKGNIGCHQVVWVLEVRVCLVRDSNPKAPKQEKHSSFISSGSCQLTCSDRLTETCYREYNKDSITEMSGNRKSILLNLCFSKKIARICMVFVAKYVQKERILSWSLLTTLFYNQCSHSSTLLLVHVLHKKCNLLSRMFLLLVSSSLL